jgi:hypothetical protein
MAPCGWYFMQTLTGSGKLKAFRYNKRDYARHVVKTIFTLFIFVALEAAVLLLVPNDSSYFVFVTFKYAFPAALKGFIVYFLIPVVWFDLYRADGSREKYLRTKEQKTQEDIQKVLKKNFKNEPCDEIDYGVELRHRFGKSVQVI